MTGPGRGLRRAAEDRRGQAAGLGGGGPAGCEGLDLCFRWVRRGGKALSKDAAWDPRGYCVENSP